MPVRKARPTDVEAVLGLARDFVVSFELTETAFKDAFAELLDSSNAAMLVAEVRGEIVGYLLVFDHVTFFANGRVAWVEEIMVREDWRRKGAGRELMDAAETWADARGAKLVALATRRAATFYRALGYEESATYFRKVLQTG